MVSDEKQTVPYSNLTPEVILQAVEAIGFAPSGGLLALNSYENRVYQIELNEGDFVVAKFYRPGRWSRETIIEEHHFALELAAQEIPVIPPIIQNDNSLFEYAGYWFSLYPRRGGRWPELDDAQVLKQLGRLLGRIHAVGRTGRFVHRPKFSVAEYAKAPLDFILQNNFVAPELLHNFKQAAEALLEHAVNQFESVMPFSLRIHGDFHPGNILTNGDTFHLVDLDDCMSGPAVQDLWMLLSGEPHEMSVQFNHLLEGYELFCEFDRSELALIESLRALRLVHYCGWLAQRWHDPAFKQHFPWFNTPRYWEDQIVTFREQLERCQWPTLDLDV